MNRTEFTEKLANKAAISQAKAREIVDIIFSTEPGEGIIAVELDAGREVRLTGFGRFGTRRQGPRQGRNPKTGAVIQIPAQTLATFSSGKGLKERVRK